MGLSTNQRRQTEKLIDNNYIIEGVRLCNMTYSLTQGIYLEITVIGIMDFGGVTSAFFCAIYMVLGNWTTQAIVL